MWEQQPVCNDINKFDKKKDHWAPYIIDQFKGTKGIRGSSYSESNHSGVISFVIEHTDDLHGAMAELMKCQKCLMMKNYHIICSVYLQLKVIHQNHSPKGYQSNFFVWSISLFMSGRILFNKVMLWQCKYNKRHNNIRIVQFHFSI